MSLKPSDSIEQQLNTLLYLSDAFVDLVKIDDYFYFFNTLDNAYDAWQDHPKASFEQAVPDILQPLDPFLDSSVDPHLELTNDPIIFAICEFWKSGLDFTYLDVGANYGVTVIPTAGFIRRMGRWNRCIAFEPGVAVNLLTHSVEVNGLADMIQVDSRAADARSGTALFQSMLGHSASNSLLDLQRHFFSNIPVARRTVVKTVKLDDVLKETRKGIIAKIDTEGNDFRVMTGLERTISERPCILLFEFNPGYVAQLGEPSALIERWEQQFLMYSIIPDGCEAWAIPVDRAAKREWIDRVVSSTHRYVNVFCIKKDMPNHDRIVQDFERKFIRASG